MNDKKISSFLQSEESSWIDWIEDLTEYAPVLLAIFSNAAVIFADYRAFDVMYQMTGIWWKALSASLACAIPFILWEIAWQYSHVAKSWRTTSLLMAGVAFATSIILGIADYVGFTSDYADLLLGGVVVLTALHTVVGLLYFYNDPRVARKRKASKMMSQMQDQHLNAGVANALLEHGAYLLERLEQLNRQYDPEDVEDIIQLLSPQNRSTRLPVRTSKKMTAHTAVSSTAQKPPSGIDGNENPSTGGR